MVITVKSFRMYKILRWLGFKRIGIMSKKNDLYFIPCDKVLDDTNILDTAFWESLVDDKNKEGNAQ